MAEANTVCSMCGDVGFSDKLFQCARCLSRFQHSYCSNYYAEETTGICDWCLSEEQSITPKHTKKPAAKDVTGTVKQSSPGDKFKQETEHVDGGSRPEKSPGSGSSSKPSGRRYKLLKDVLC